MTDGCCPQCEGRGEVGIACAERTCTRRGYHFVPLARADALDDAPDPMIGKLMGRKYLLVGRIGEGGFGAVYLALQLPIRMKVALKLLKLNDLTKERVDGLLVKFEGEARALAQINNDPNIVGLVDYGRHQGTPYLVMRYVDNAVPLKTEIHRRRHHQLSWTPAEIRHVLRQLLSGLGAAHSLKIIHRDIKTENIMLQSIRNDELLVLILDFGLAKFVEARTETSQVMGTPVYMAPEQLTRKNIGPWTDLYAVGIIAWELMLGSRPFEGTVQEILAQKLASPDPTEILDQSTPAPVVDFLRKAIDRDPAARFRSAPEMLAALEPAVNALEPAAPAPEPTLVPDITVAMGGGYGRRTSAPSEPTPSGRGKLAAAVFLALLLLVGGGFGVWSWLDSKPDTKPDRNKTRSDRAAQTEEPKPAADEGVVVTAFASAPAPDEQEPVIPEPVIPEPAAEETTIEPAVVVEAMADDFGEMEIVAVVEPAAEPEGEPAPQAVPKTWGEQVSETAKTAARVLTECNANYLKRLNPDELLVGKPALVTDDADLTVLGRDCGPIVDLLPAMSELVDNRHPAAEALLLKWSLLADLYARTAAQVVNIGAPPRQRKAARDRLLKVLPEMTADLIPAVIAGLEPFTSVAPTAEPEPPVYPSTKLAREPALATLGLLMKKTTPELGALHDEWKIHAYDQQRANEYARRRYLAYVDLIWSRRPKHERALVAAVSTDDAAFDKELQEAASRYYAAVDAYLATGWRSGLEAIEDRTMIDEPKLAAAEKSFRTARKTFDKATKHLRIPGKTKKPDKPPTAARVPSKPATKPAPSKPAASAPKPGLSKLDQAKQLEAEAKAAKRASNLPLAEKLYAKCLAVHPGMASCRADLAVLLMVRGQRCPALKHMRRYVKSRPGSSKSAQFKRLIEQFEPQCL